MTAMLLLGQDDLAPLMHPDNVKEPLCEVDAEYAHLVFHWTRLLWLNGFTGLEIILAHCSRSAQGVGPFHYDRAALVGPLSRFTVWHTGPQGPVCANGDCPSRGEPVAPASIVEGLYPGHRPKKW